MRDWFKARNIWGAAITALSDEEAGRLAKAIWTYTMTGTLVEIEGAGKGILAMILLTLGQDEERDSEISAKRSMATAGIRRQKKSDDISEDQMISNDIKSDQMISNDDNKNKNKNKNIEQEQEKESKRRFAPPTLEEVTEYCRERNNSVDAQQFIDFYTSKGWKVGSQQMKDWRACVRTWERRRNSTDSSVKRLNADNFTQRDYSEVPNEMLDDLAREVELMKASGEW